MLAGWLGASGDGPQSRVISSGLYGEARRGVNAAQGYRERAQADAEADADEEGANDLDPDQTVSPCNWTESIECSPRLPVGLSSIVGLP